MEREQMAYLKYSIALVVVVILGFMLFTLTQDQDISFSRKVLAGLVNGREATQNDIDWVSFKGLDQDVGKAYSELLGEQQKAYFRKAFILNFSLSFKGVGGNLKAFTHWRIHSRDKTETVVSANALAKRMILLTVSKKSGKRKLVSIQLKE